MIIDILPLPNRGWVDEIDTMCCYSNNTKNITDDIVVLGRKFSVPSKYFKYKILETSTFGLIERTILTLEALNLDTLLSYKNKPVKMYPISTRYHIKDNKTLTIKVFRMVKAISSFIEYLTGTSVVSATKRSMDKLMDCVFENEMWDIAEATEQHLLFNSSTIEGICMDDNTSARYTMLNGDTIYENLIMEQDWARCLGNDLHINTILSNITAPVVYAIHNIDFMSRVYIETETLLSTQLRSCLSVAYKAHMLKTQMLSKPLFKDKPVTKIPKLLKPVVMEVINYLDTSIYTDLSIEIGRQQVIVNYIGSRYNKTLGTQLFLDKLKTHFDSWFEQDPTIIKISLTKTWLEEIYITIHKHKHQLPLYIDMVMWSLGSHSVIEY